MGITINTLTTAGKTTKDGKERQLTSFEVADFLDASTGKNTAISTKLAGDIMGKLEMMKEAVDGSLDDLSNKSVTKLLTDSIPGISGFLTSQDESAHTFLASLAAAYEEYQADGGVSVTNPASGLAAFINTQFSFEAVRSLTVEDVQAKISDFLEDAVMVLLEKEKANGLTPDGRVKMKAPKKAKDK